MTSERISRILKLRDQHKSYRTIAAELGIPVNTVKSCLHRIQGKTEAGQIGQDETSCIILCRQCKVSLHQAKHGKKRCFCSDHCRYTWWNAHRDLSRRASAHQQTCEMCGAVFHTYKGHFCSRACYGKYRTMKAGDEYDQRHYRILFSDRPDQNYDQTGDYQPGRF